MRRRRSRRRRTRRRRQRRQRGGGKKKGKDKTRKLVKAAKKRSRKKQPPQLLKKLGIQKYQTLNDDNIEWGEELGEITQWVETDPKTGKVVRVLDSQEAAAAEARAASDAASSNQTSDERKFNEWSELLGLNNSNSNEYSSSEQNDTPRKKATYAQIPKKPGTYAQLPSPLYREGQFIRGVQTNADAGAMAAILGTRRRRSPSPTPSLPKFDVDEYYESVEDAGYAEILPIGSEIVGHGKRTDGTRFYKVRMGPKNIPKGFKNAGNPHTREYAASPGSYVKEFDAAFPDGHAPFLEDEAGGLKKLEKLVMDYIAKHPVAGAGGIYGENSNSNGGGRRRKRRKKRTRRKRRSRRRRTRRRRRRKQRGGMDLSPKFRYTAQDFLDDAKSKETDHPPKPWW